jgi:UDP:flavonoid glycosyltransferase YjiC (YdhE family)
MNVLVTPLDWGLGHATRCIPLIDKLQKLGHRVSIAGSGASLDLLKIEFPSSKFFAIASYGISYSTRLPLALHLSLRIPSLLRVIRKEHEQVADIAKKENISFVISDNRYGCYHEKNTIGDHHTSAIDPGAA